ncbi:MAG TPA: hypothetical protein VLE23_11675 [Geminicoccaceae bacterium]|nr:hypothetical protein [Geminicoccaceae bacterium]
MTEQRIILTPGPVTPSATTRQAMLRDYSLNEPDFLALTAELRATLVEPARGRDLFRIGCMGAFDDAVMRAVVRAVGEAMAEMGVADRRPAARPTAAE